jgi:hypothetical protein
MNAENVSREGAKTRSGEKAQPELLLVPADVAGTGSQQAAGTGSSLSNNAGALRAFASSRENNENANAGAGTLTSSCENEDNPPPRRFILIEMDPRLSD